MFSPGRAPAAVRSEPAPDIGLADEGFVFGEREVLWADVVRIRTYKLDLEDIDCVCVSFELDRSPLVEVTEESNGFNHLIDELLVQFPSIDADWYSRVLTPAFERNETVLFERAVGRAS